MIYPVPVEEFPKIYKEKMKRDFPSTERKPLATIKRLYSKGMYSCYTYNNADGEMLAYACFLSTPSTNSVLLDYLAVEQEHRGEGIGGKFLQALHKEYEKKGCDGILVEAEWPEMAKDEDDLKIRNRRISFYENNGGERTNVIWKAFGVDYSLIWLPVKKHEFQVDIAEEIKTIYNDSTFEFIIKIATDATLTGADI